MAILAAARCRAAATTQTFALEQKADCQTGKGEHEQQQDSEKNLHGVTSFTNGWNTISEISQSLGMADHPFQGFFFLIFQGLEQISGFL